jgi:uncharacterized protein with NRDE domain
LKAEKQTAEQEEQDKINKVAEQLEFWRKRKKRKKPLERRLKNQRKHRNKLSGMSNLLLLINKPDNLADQSLPDWDQKKAVTWEQPITSIQGRLNLRGQKEPTHAHHREDQNVAGWWTEKKVTENQNVNHATENLEGRHH